MEKEVVVCCRCLTKVYPSKVEGYDYQCFVHDEDLYEFETIKMDKDIYLDMTAEVLGYPRDDIERILDEYDEYINEFINNVVANDSPLSLDDYIETKIKSPFLLYS